MTKFDFDKIIDRRNTGSLKWDVNDGELPMWVADMDFETAPAVKEAVKKVADLGVYGYKIVPERWFSAIQNWWKVRHNYVIRKEWLCFCTGVIPAVTSVVKRLSNVGDNVAIFTPVYDIFFHSVENTGRKVLECPLVYDGKKYDIDFNDFENKLKLSDTALLILCNPHNPVGKIWDKDTLSKIGKLCRKYNVRVISDEIHCDLTMPDTDYVPFASASDVCRDISVTCLSISKTFNAAGLQSAAVFVPNEEMRKLIVRGLNADEVAEPNAFACEGAVAAFESGGEWLDELRLCIFDNHKILREYVKNNLPELYVIDQNATYLAWVDVSKVTDDAAVLCKHIREKTGLFITAGNQYRGNGKSFVRINVACPKATLLDGLDRLKKGVGSFN